MTSFEMSENALAQDIHSPYFSIVTKCALINAIWGSQYSTQAFHNDPLLASSYLRYYSEQCRNALHSESCTILVSTHADVVGIIHQIQEPGSTRQTTERFLQAKCKDATRVKDVKKVVGALVDLAARLLLMLDVGERPNEVAWTKPLHWERGPVQLLLNDRFIQPAVFGRQRPIIRLNWTDYSLRIIWNALRDCRLYGLIISLTTST